MRIDFECTGGFANLQLVFKAKTDGLPQELVQELMRLVQESNFFELEPGDLKPAAPGPPDVFSYQLSLTEGSHSNALSCTDVTAPTSLHPLLSLLRKLALDRKR